MVGLARTAQKKSAYSILLLVGGFTLSFLFLTTAMEKISMSTAYAVWTGIGTVGSAVWGMLFGGEPATFSRIFFIFLILFAVIGLKIFV